MEEILNRIIEIDNKSKEIVQNEKIRKMNIDDYIESEFEKRKAAFDLAYNEDIKYQKEKIQNRLKEEKDSIKSRIELEMNTIENRVKNEENNIVDEIVKKVKSLEG